MELVKLKRERSDLQVNIDKNAKEIKGLKLEDTNLIEMIQS